MQLKVYINDKLYKTITVPGKTYDPKIVWPHIKADKEAGLLNDFGVTQKMVVRIEKS